MFSLYLNVCVSIYMHTYVHRYVPVFTFSISTYSLLHAAFDSPSEVFFLGFH